MEKEFRLMAAPLQGLTEAAWRREHWRLFGREQGDVEYFTPFIRVEKGEVRRRDLRDFTSDLNEGMNLTPQIIFRDLAEWRMLVDALVDAGASRIDMNMGCPFPPQVHKGRGAGMLARPETLSEIAEAMEGYAGTVEFSVKMRLGVKDGTEASGLAGILNAMPLRHVAVHPRTAAQQYRGELLLEELDALAGMLRHPVVFNGEVATPSDIGVLASKFDGVIVGRGLLRRPSLFAEYMTGRELSAEEREELWMRLLEGTGKILEGRLCGEAQLRDKVRPYWEYAPETMDRRVVKAGRKLPYTRGDAHGVRLLHWGHARSELALGTRTECACYTGDAHGVS